MGEPRAGSNRKWVLILVGGVLALTVVFSLLEELVPHEAGADRPSVPGEDPAPIRPELSRQGDDTVIIDAGFMHNSSIRYGGDDAAQQADALIACLEAGIETEFGPVDAPLNPLEGVDPRSQRREMRFLMKEIQDRCTEELTLRSGGIDAPRAPTSPQP